MNSKERKHASKFLSLVLRHQPEVIQINLDPAGWIEVDVLLAALSKAGRRLSRSELEEVVETNDKQRFAFSDDGKRIRANQGHSVDVELGYAAADPPETLMHGTVDRFIDQIRSEGLAKMSRHHVHLHEDLQVASAVGQRRGEPVILTIQAAQMRAAGYEFFVTPNRVWLVDHVPAEYIDFPEG